MFTVLDAANFTDLNVKVQAELKMGRYPYGNPFELEGKQCQTMYLDETQPIVENAVSYVIASDGAVTTLDWKEVSLETVLCLQGLFPV
jgi:hypothetical protein